MCIRDSALSERPATERAHHYKIGNDKRQFQFVPFFACNRSEYLSLIHIWEYKNTETDATLKPLEIEHEKRMLLIKENREKENKTEAQYLSLIHILS